MKAIDEIVPVRKEAFVADRVVFGGGKVEEVQMLPEGAKRGGNEDGFRLWLMEVAHVEHAPAPEVWRVVA